MNATKPMPNVPLLAAILLGKFSVWLGAAVGPIYLALFVLAMTQAGPDRPAAAAIALPTLLPTVGIALAAVGPVLAAALGRPFPRVCLFALALHLAVLGMAEVLPLLQPLG